MKKFSDWLDSKPKLVERLTALFGINDTNISNWRHGRRPIPWVHMPAIAKMSRGFMTLRELMDHRRQNFPRKASDV